VPLPVPRKRDPREKSKPRDVESALERAPDRDPSVNEPVDERGESNSRERTADPSQSHRPGGSGDATH
jgi:hypothetical protein